MRQPPLGKNDDSRRTPSARSAPVSPPARPSPSAPALHPTTGTSARSAAATPSPGSGRRTSLPPTSRSSGPPLTATTTQARPPTSARHSRTTSVAAAHAVSLLMEPPELARCSREVLVEMVVRHQRDLEEAQAKIATLDEGKEDLLQENQTLERDFEMARGKIDDLLAEESRMEEELAGRIEVLDKLRSTVRELEREKREGEKRYREQADSFDSERQSWYDQEQHYKLRIKNLSKSTIRKGRESEPPPKPSRDLSDLSGSDSETPSRRPSRADSSASLRSSATSPAPSNGPSPNELALQDQLSSLTTAHSSLTTTLRALQVELSELKRVYQDLQEQNESYEILLGERTLNGEIPGSELFRRSSCWDDSDSFSPITHLEAVGEDSAEDEEENFESGEEGEEEIDVEKVLLETQGTGSANSGAVAAAPANGKKRKPIKKSGGGGGLDLAAELEAAQMADDEEPVDRKKKVIKRKDSVALMGGEDLRSEIRQLREANKALTLYVSKIVDRVCSQEGFEKVLAVDFRNTPKTGGTSPQPLSKETPVNEQIKFRTPFTKSNAPVPGALNLPPRLSNTPATPGSGMTSPNPNSAEKRGILGWGSSITSVFGSNPLSRPSHSSSGSITNMKAFKLGSGSSESGSARKLEVEEDDDDLAERERLRLEMAKHGIQDSGNSWGSRKTSAATMEGPSESLSGVGSPMSPSSAPFSTPLPEDAEAEVLLEASPDEVQIAFRERKFKEQEAKGSLAAGNASGFTEPKRRRHRPGSMSSRSTSSASGSFAGVGLGINDTPNKLTPETSPSIASPASPDPLAQRPGEDEAGWGQRLKRLSLGSWATPTPPSTQ